MNERELKRLVLFQARRGDDEMREHEVDCFARHLEIDHAHIEIFDILEGNELRLEALLRDPDACFFIGGSGDYSVSQGGPDSLLNFVRRVIPRLVGTGRPIFGSCWGLHALTEGLGGVVERTGHTEVGTFTVRKHAEYTDSLLDDLPDEFAGQMGHKDWVIELPDGARPIAENDMSPYQGVRFGDGPVYGLQFHAELSVDDNRDRFLHYIESYGGRNEKFDAKLELFEPSPHANTLLSRFRELYCEVVATEMTEERGQSAGAAAGENPQDPPARDETVAQTALNKLARGG